MFMIKQHNFFQLSLCLIGELREVQDTVAQWHHQLSDFFLKQDFFLNNLDFYYRENNGFLFKIATFQEYEAYSFY